jgi:hypothetical protein
MTGVTGGYSIAGQRAAVDAVSGERRSVGDAEDSGSSGAWHGKEETRGERRGPRSVAVRTYP